MDPIRNIGSSNVTAASRGRGAEGHVLPTWRKRLSFRGQPYRYAQHQNGVMGHLQVRVLAASGIPGTTRSLLSSVQGAIDGVYISVSQGKSSERTSASETEADATGGLRVAWARELLMLEVPKDEIPAGEAAVLEFQVCSQDNIVQSMLNSAMSTVMGSQGSLLGAGKLDVSCVLAGATHLIDTWVELEPRGRVHVHVEYEPNGIEPAPNDVVYLESFVRWGESLVIPPGTPMVVLHRRSPFLLVAFDTFTGREGRIRLHRNCVWVVERLSWFDVALATAARPIDALLRTDSGSWLVRKARGLLAPLVLVAVPLMASLQVALSAMRMATRSVVMGVQASVREGPPP